MYQIYNTITLMFLIVSCATDYASTIDANLNQWKGKPSDDLVSQWGAPQATYKLTDGTNIITYSNQSVTTRNYSYYYQPAPYDSISYTKFCKISFFVDKTTKKIIRYTYKGDQATCLQIINPNLTVQ